MKITDEELAELKDIKKRKRGQETGYTCEIYNETLDALINRLEAAEACLFDVWHSSIADDKLEAWKRACGTDEYSKLANRASQIEKSTVVGNYYRLRKSTMLEA